MLTCEIIDKLGEDSLHIGHGNGGGQGCTYYFAFFQREINYYVNSLYGDISFISVCLAYYYNIKIHDHLIPLHFWF